MTLQGSGNLVTNETSCERVRTLPAGENRCAYVRANCPSESRIWNLWYLEHFYCFAQPSGLAAEIFLQACYGCLLVLIFRVLGSTAEDFFSPILTQISQDLGLPPRFAGVTLLALGNGAPDLVSSIAFIKAGKYQVAISGLFGGGMFVGAAIAGFVIFTAEGVKARGALLRDVSSYMVATLVVAIIFRSTRMSWGAAVVLLLMYLLFVATVLAADIAHIWRAKIRGQSEPEKPSERQRLLAGDLARPPEADLPEGAPSFGSAHSIELTEGQPSTLGSDAAERVSWSQGHSGGRESAWSVEGAQLTYNEKVHMSGQTYRQMALAEIAHSATFFGDAAMEQARRAALTGPEPHAIAEEGQYEPPRPLQEGESQPEAGTTRMASTSPEHKEAQERVHQWCAVDQQRRPERESGSEPAAGPSGRPPDESGEGQAQETPLSALAHIWRILKGALKILEVGFWAAELPLVWLRRLTIPLIDNDSYNRKWLIASTIGTPLAFMWYFHWLTLPSAGIAIAVSAIAAVLVAEGTVSSKPPEWSCGLQFPVGAAVMAAIGFTAAALWIDTIAGELVALLDYFGTLSGIPHEVLGLTVLAWGNSVGDLSTNTAMARKGLSNMAMTACFACPTFNLLMALGLGFMRYFASNDVNSVRVALQAVDIPAIVIIVTNGVLLIMTGIAHKGWVPKWYGVVPLVLYALYVCVSLAVAFG